MANAGSCKFIKLTQDQLKQCHEEHQKAIEVVVYQHQKCASLAKTEGPRESVMIKKTAMILHQCLKRAATPLPKKELRALTQKASKS